MQDSKTHINFTTHCAHICVDGDLIKVFKYSDHGCDFEQFTDQEAASDYIMMPLNRIHYRVAFPGED
jgi:hypothetical protein